ncbi:non-homologous end-joining DNA ligase, partial [Pseudomonas aeruginosa]|uniref:non-homologous end-joining DNA ligase n=3 Tax=Pseudomonas aeruginosa TaxID=287 RepID=UPI00065006DC
GDALLGARAAAERLQQVFDQAPLAEGRSTREPVDGAVALHGLGHAYEGVEVLADIDLELEDGSLVALVGPSGSGKSTLLHLLARYMDAQRGELEVGGLALKDMPDAVRHRHIALVGQQAAALEISLADNIALFRPDADLQEIRQAARDACLDERIMALPRGYDSVPGRDLQLSGGELQRLALARALLSPARLLLLDEPTSALDPQTARQVLRDLRERPVSLVRGPDGIGGELFFQKHAARLKIPGIVQLDPALDPGHPPLLQIRSAEALVGAVQMGSIEFHTWNASLANLERPDRFVLDLDPDPALPWKRMLEATQLSLTLLDELGLRAFLKTSGGKGMHLLVPLERRHGWDEVKDFAQAISQHLARLMPERFSAVSGPRNRVGKIFVDYLRNSRGASTVAAYSVRAREGLPVSVPVFREELDSLQGANQWNLRSLPQRLDELAGDDPWADYAGTRQRISAAMRRQLGRG